MWFGDFSPLVLAKGKEDGGGGEEARRWVDSLSLNAKTCLTGIRALSLNPWLLGGALIHLFAEKALRISMEPQEAHL